MKPVEDAFSSDIFRGVILPGVVLSAGFHPLISKWISVVESLYRVGSIALIVAETIFFGLAISSAIQWIYYVYEGFRLEWLTSLAGWLNRRTLNRKQQERARIQGRRDFDELPPSDQARVTEIYEYLCDFPVRRSHDGSKEYFADRPTRLGNIIATYELYAESRYGIDGVFFWNHLLNLAPEPGRKQFEEKYSFAESLVLASFAGAVVAVFHAIVLLGFAVGRLDESFVLLRLSTGPTLSASLTFFGIVVWLLFYWVALPAHRDAGDSLRANVDSALPNFLEWAMRLPCPPSKETIRKVTQLNEYLKTLD